MYINKVKQFSFETGYFPKVGECSNVLCISSEIGCGVNCVMCESGRNGFIRNLTSQEVFEQVKIVYDYLVENDIMGKEDVFESIGIMGIGEPGNNDNWRS